MRELVGGRSIRHHAMADIECFMVSQIMVLLQYFWIALPSISMGQLLRPFPLYAPSRVPNQHISTTQWFRGPIGGDLIIP